MKTNLIIYIISLILLTFIWVGLFFYSLKLAMICIGVTCITVLPSILLKLFEEPEIMKSTTTKSHWVISDDKRIAINPTMFINEDGEFDSVGFNSYLLELKIKDKFTLNS